jgi:hypothetical protein
MPRSSLETGLVQEHGFFKLRVGKPRNWEVLPDMYLCGIQSIDV